MIEAISNRTAPVEYGKADAEEPNSSAFSAQQKLEEIVKLDALMVKINSGLLLEEALDHVFESFSSLIPYDRLALVVIEKTSQTVKLRWARSIVPMPLLSIGYSGKMTRSSLEKILSTRQPRIINSLTEYLSLNPHSESTALMVSAGIRSSLTCPLIAMDRPVGFLFFSSLSENTYRDAHADLYVRIANHLSVILDKNLQYQELLETKISLMNALARIQAGEESLAIIHAERNRTRAALAEAEEARRTAEAQREAAELAKSEVEILNEFTRSINESAGNIESLLDKIFEHLASRFRIEAGFVLFVDHGNNVLRYRFGRFSPSYTPDMVKLLREIEIPLNSSGGYIYRTYVRKRPLYLSRIALELAGDPERQLVRTLKVDSFLQVPLMIAGEVTAMVMLSNNEKPLRLTRSDIRRIKGFCDQIAGALHSAQLLMDAEDARLKLAEANRSRTIFFQNISHELRTPLTLIAGPIESARRKGETLDESTMKVVLKNARRMQRLVNHLLDLQKITTGKLELKLRYFDLGSFCSTTFSSFKPYAAVRGVQLLDSLLEKKLAVHADPAEIEKCLYNYLSNALKFTPAGGTIRMDLEEIAAANSGNYARVIVTDTGTGMTAGQVDGLFQRFGRSEESLLKEQSGSGLGLALVKELVELHNGSVGVESKPGTGSKFFFTLPLAPPGIALEDLDSIPQTTSGLELETGSDRPADFIGENQTLPSQNSALKTSGITYRILIVEDNKELRNYMARIFSAEGYIVVLAENGAAGLKQVLLQRPDIVITDLMMPRMSGIEMIKEIRQMEPFHTLPIVLLTARADDQTRKEVREAGANSYLSKPFNEMELLVACRNLIALKDRERSLLRELDHARKIQNNLLPDRVPERKGTKIAALYRPMSMIGGDIYDFVEYANGSLGIFVADVSGHGIPAAMIASIAKVILSMLGASITSPSKLLLHLNEQLLGRTAGNFMTCFYGILDPQNRSFVYSNAGHPGFLLVRDGAGQYSKGRGKMLGIFQDPGIGDNMLSIEEGDRLFFHTDGISESSNAAGEFFGEARLCQIAEELEKEPLASQIEHMVMTAEAFQGKPEFSDDVMLIGIEVSGH